MEGGVRVQELELKAIVAKNISALRSENKMTQLELGNAISYSDKAVSKWERGEAIPDVYVLLKLSEIFGCSVDYLLHDHGDEQKLPTQKRPVNHVAVSLIALLGVWTAALLAFIVMYLAGFTYPLIFQYALVVSLILLTVFNSIWGRKLFGFIIISALTLSIVATVYLLFLNIGYNYWQILLLGVPALIIVLLCFFVKHGGKRTTKK